METGKIEFNIMDSNEYMFKRDFMNAIEKIPERLDRLIELIEEQNLLIGTEEGCCPGCDGTCGEEDDGK